jgi:hypothetical protein
MGGAGVVEVCRGAERVEGKEVAAGMGGTTDQLEVAAGAGAMECVMVVMIERLELPPSCPDAGSCVTASSFALV